MEAKTVILSVLLLSFVLAQVHVEAKLTSCCPSTTSRNIYIACLSRTPSQQVCASLAGCILQTSSTCVPPNIHETLENTGAIVESYCKLGCVSSVCNALTALQTSGEAAEQCIVACSEFCTKGSANAIEIA